MIRWGEIQFDLRRVTVVGSFAGSGPRSVSLRGDFG